MMHPILETISDPPRKDVLDEETQERWLSLAKRLHSIDPDKFRELLSITTDVVEANEILDRIPWPRRGSGVLQA